ncbi:carboxypeptidase regulatory-like domain-containing protein [Fodinibius halophilus]|uniref:Carboxypeptidase-like regulatory domain-containing protein n=1 Tax=Fodinibius halophilus TaxID=1736908 RepID=A0A6M1T1V7_9BACT|nr:carboxypeptidase regulatory-like domain-containing protein [Fodinibius halophilus]NGP87997.1 carboxypeptidase-like regulatory domain-containing protein [Fodinibius halophilus]
MKKRFLLFLPLVLVALVLQSCKSGSDSSIISGQVTDKNTGTPIKGAFVDVIKPEDITNTATTDSLGNFSFDVEVNEAQPFLLEVSKQNYKPGYTSFKIAPGKNIEDLIVKLESSTQDGGGDGDDGDVGGEAGGPASLELTNLTEPEIDVAGTGGKTNTTFTFEVSDSAGRVVDYPVDVEFNIIDGPNGGESIKPSVATTGVNSPVGKVKSNLSAGDSSGTVRIEAVIRRPDVNLTIRSTPIRVAIASGFPDQENFNVAPAVHNFDAFGYIDENHTNPITASVGDLKGNPVTENTVVYFSASKNNLNGGGGLVSSSSPTDENGFATVELFANGSQPTGHPQGPGFIDVIAETDANSITETTTILLTTPEANINVSPTTLNISNGGGQTFTVTITDLNGYPMAANTEITVTPSEGLSASGSITDLKLGDYFAPGPDRTEFEVTISDANPDETNPTEGNFTIKVVTPSGRESTRTISGSRAKTK